MASPPPGPCLEVEDLGFRVRERELLAGLSFRLHPGDVVHLVGENGCGKSTLLRLLAGLLPPDLGAIRLCGERLSPARARIDLAYLPDHCRPSAWLSAREYLEFRARLRLAPQEVGPAIDAAIRDWDLSPLGERPLGVLSAGETRRVELAATWLGDARLLLLDEPLSPLDTAHAGLLLDRIRARAEAGTSAVLLTGHLRDAPLAIPHHAWTLRAGALEMPSSHPAPPSSSSLSPDSADPGSPP